MDLKISPADRKLVAATHGHGAWKRALRGEEEPPAGLSAETAGIELTALPGPYGEWLKLTAALGEPADLVTAIADASGRRVEERSLGRRPAGSFEWNWSCAHLPPGVYFATLRSDRWAATVRWVKP